MDAVVINSTDLRTRTREVMERVKFRGERFLVQTFGKPSAIIISIEEYERLSKPSTEREGPLSASDIRSD